MQMKRRTRWWLYWGMGFLIVLLGVFFLLSKQRYLLNNVVRHVDLRLLQFQRISDKLNGSFKLHFLNDSLTISQYRENKGEWEVYQSYSYPRQISSSLDKFDVVFHDGELIEMSLGQGKEILQPYVILYFYPKAKQNLQKGVIFYEESGGWRVLKKKTGV